MFLSSQLEHFGYAIWRIIFENLATYIVKVCVRASMCLCVHIHELLWSSYVVILKWVVAFIVR